MGANWLAITTDSQVLAKLDRLGLLSFSRAVFDRCIKLWGCGLLVKEFADARSGSYIRIAHVSLACSC